MKREKPEAKRSHAGRGGNNVSLHPLTPDQALAGLLKISPKDAADVREKSTPVRKGKKK